MTVNGKPLVWTIMHTHHPYASILKRYVVGRKCNQWIAGSVGAAAQRRTQKEQPELMPEAP